MEPLRPLARSLTLKLARLLNDTDTGKSGKATRSQLEIRMNDSKKTVNSLEMAVAQGVAKARTALCFIQGFELSHPPVPVGYLQLPTTSPILHRPDRHPRYFVLGVLLPQSMRRAFLYLLFLHLSFLHLRGRTVAGRTRWTVGVVVALGHA